MSTEKEKARSRAWYYANKDKALAAMKQWRENNPEKAANSSSEWRQKHPERALALQRAYRKKNSVKVKEYQSAWAHKNRVSLREQLLARQGGKCAICKSNNPHDKTWHKDHDHLTGRVRGVLCKPCNIGLGHFKDDIKRLRAAIRYLARPGE